MRTKTVLIPLAVIVAMLTAAAITAVSLTPSGTPNPARTSVAPSSPVGLPGVTLRQIDGGPHYYAHIDPLVPGWTSTS